MSDTTPLLDDYLDEEQAARELQCVPRTLKRARASGNGPKYIRAPGRHKVMYRRSALREWLLSMEAANV
jgi:hypothetical protein